MADNNTDLIIPAEEAEQSAIAIYTKGEAFDQLYGRIANLAQEHEADVSTKEGREELRTLAYKVVRTKTTLDKLGAKLAEEARQKVKSIDAARKDIRDRLDGLRDKVRKPLTDYEVAEEARVKEVESRLSRIVELKQVPFDATSDQIAAMRRELDELGEYKDWGASLDHAVTVIEDAMKILATAHAAAKEREKIAAERAELERKEAERQAEEQQRLEQERIEREAREKAERDRQAEIERLQREKEEAEMKAAVAEQAAREAEARAKREAEEAAERERQRIADEQRRAEEQAAREKAEREAREKAEKEAAQKARLAQERLARLAEQHRLEAFEDIALYNDDPNKLLQAIMDGKVRHVVFRPGAHVAEKAA